MIRPPLRALIPPTLFLVLVNVAACGAMVSPVGDAGVDASADRVGADAVDVLLRDLVDRTDVPISICAADFPCRPGETIRCTGSSTFVRVESRDCHTVCPPGPCTGGVCASTGVTGRCPPDTVCMANRTTGIDECAAVAVPDGGTPDASRCPVRPEPTTCCYDDTDCAPGMVCFSADCGARRPGECVPRPERGNCWRDSDCATTERCVGTTYCPCGAVCAVGTNPGRCVPR